MRDRQAMASEIILVRKTGCDPSYGILTVTVSPSVLGGANASGLNSPTLALDTAGGSVSERGGG